jgi:hypothetical protein
MQSFTKRIPVEKGFSPEFFFTRIYTVNSVHYHISVMDKSGHSHFFTMEQKNEQWKIINAPKIPDWIVRIEEQLEEAITESI